MRNSLCCSLVEYSYKINFWCFRALFVPGRQSHFLFVNLLVMRNWVNLLLLLSFFRQGKRKTSVLQDILCEMSLADCRIIFSPVPFIPKLHLEFVDYICLICHSTSTLCSDNAEHVWVPLLWFFLFTHHFFFLSNLKFLSAFQDIWEHLKIIISKWSSNEGRAFVKSLLESCECLLWCFTLFACLFSVRLAIDVAEVWRMP